MSQQVMRIGVITLKRPDQASAVRTAVTRLPGITSLISANMDPSNLNDDFQSSSSTKQVFRYEGCPAVVTIVGNQVSLFADDNTFRKLEELLRLDFGFGQTI